jgi:hypothetical protein
MSHNIEEAVEELKAENLELKLGAIKKELTTFKTDIHRHLDLVMSTNKEQLDIIEKNTEKTNGSVARAMEKINALEREDNKKQIEELKGELEKTKKETGFLRLLHNNRWVAILVVSFMYLFTIQEVRQLVFNWLKIIS